MPSVSFTILVELCNVHLLTIGISDYELFFRAIGLSEYQLSERRMEKTIGLSDIGFQIQTISLANIGHKNYWLPNSACQYEGKLM